MFNISFRTGKDGSLVYGDKSTKKEEYISDTFGRSRIKADLCAMFMDFISLTGNLRDSNHPFFKFDDDKQKEYTDNSGFFVALKEYIDLGISNPTFFNESCFMYFLYINNASIPAMHPELTLLDGCASNDTEKYINVDGLTLLEKKMRGFIAGGDKVFDIPLTTYTCDTVEDACIASLHFLITHGYNIRKCENCGKYFVPLRKDAIYCDRMSPFNKRRTCKKDGALRKHAATAQNDNLIKWATTIKNNRAQRARRNPDNQRLQAEYFEWDNTFRKMKEDYQKGIVSESQFRKWLEDNIRYDGY